MSYPTLPQILERGARHHGPAPAILHGDRTLTWADFRDRVAAAAGVLAELGVQEGERYAVMAHNGWPLEEVKWAGFWLGAVPVPINWRLAPPEVAHIVRDADCRLVFAEAGFADTFKAEPLAPWADSVLTIPDDIDARAAAATPADPAPPDPDRDAIVYYTGGTTGRSKGVRLSHANITSNGVAVGLGYSARSDDVWLHTPPMFHSADLLSTAWFLLGGAHCYLPTFSPAAFFETVARHRVTATVAVPAMLIAILSDPGFAKADLSSLRLLSCGASPIPLEWLKRVDEALPGVDFSYSYGLTETSPDLTIFDPREFRAAIESGDDDGRIRSVGKPNVLNELRVVGPDGRDVPPGEVGELWARGPNITKGYLNLPDVTAAALEDGWLHTGDVARIDDEGYVYLLDRLKDMVITGGENVYTTEVEGALQAHPRVAEAAVIGVPDAKMGEALMAVIKVAGEGDPPREDELIAHCRQLIGGYKIPRRYAFLDELPRSALGKVLKSELRKHYEG